MNAWVSTLAQAFFTFAGVPSRAKLCHSNELSVGAGGFTGMASFAELAAQGQSWYCANQLLNQEQL
jgi:hypothetical protein